MSVRDMFAAMFGLLGMTTGAGLAVAVNRTWTAQHTTTLLGGALVLAGLVGVALIVAAWSYGTTHGAGVGQAGPVLDLDARRIPPERERLELENELRRERLAALRRAADPPPLAPIVPDWTREASL